MKQIPILSGKAMIVEMPEGAETIHLAFNDGFWHLIYFTYHGEILTRKRMPSGRWQIVGMLSEVTNAELADVTGFYYNKYNERYVEMPTSDMRATPIGDIEDAIRAEGYSLDENPIAVPDFSGGNIRFSETVEYAKAQSRVLDRSRCLLLGREDG